MAARLLVLGKTVLSLGLSNVVRVAAYRVGLKTGLHPVRRLRHSPPPGGPFFRFARSRAVPEAPGAWRGRTRYFGWLELPLGSVPPPWHVNSLTGVAAPGVERPWWANTHFDSALGDVKAIWEPSRMDWVVNFAQQASAGVPEALERLNAWLSGWCAGNPPYRGHNWMCGQEASIRVMHLAVAALVLGETLSLLPALKDLLSIHLLRIAPTMGYAIGQDNNHGTSEAAALFIGGSWLEALEPGAGRGWAQTGRRWLENRVRRLIQPDGSFSQHSINYHRLMLDTLCLAEIWRRHLNRPGFSPLFGARAAAAAEWLRAMTDPLTGDTPNLGANDGANLLPLTDADWRDCRPAVQLATTLFQSRYAYSGPGPWQAHLDWLGVAPAAAAAARLESRLFDGGGQAVLRRGDAWAVLRYPRFRFRPGDADPLHLDLWVAGENLLRDGGSFSYAAEPEWQGYFPGIRAHNTVQFDSGEPMPRLGRFLWGYWLQTDTTPVLEDNGPAVSVSAAYHDAQGAAHSRRVELRGDRLTVEDTVSGFRRAAVLRWRLRPGNWTVAGTAATDGRHQVDVSATVPITRCELVPGWESRYYLQKTNLPVLEVEIGVPGTVLSEYRWTG